MNMDDSCVSGVERTVRLSTTDTHARAHTHAPYDWPRPRYHPEYNLSYYAGLIGTRGERMIGMGFFHSPEDHQKYVDDMTDLSQDPERKDLRWKYGIDDDLISNDIKQAEVRNWLKLLLTTGWKN